MDRREFWDKSSVRLLRTTLFIVWTVACSHSGIAVAPTSGCRCDAALATAESAFTTLEVGLQRHNMAASLERFQALVENSPDVISLMDANGEVLYASAATAAVLGYQPEELLGRNGLDLLHPEDRDPTLRVLKKVLEEPQWPNRMQARIRQKDGQWRWVTASNLLDDPHVGAIVINYREIDARRAEEGTASQRNLLLINAELKAFAHTVAHDLREPLRTISACTEILIRHSQIDDAHKQTASFIVDG